MAKKKKAKKGGVARAIGAKIGAEIDKELAKGGDCKDWNWGDKFGGNKSDSAGFAYFLGIIGAAVYYIQNADGFWIGVLGVLKALVWPAMVIYKLLGL